MNNGWVASEAQAAIDHYVKKGIPRDLALRVYSTRLLGRDPKLVLHGGGNTSVKTMLPDLLGEPVEVLLRQRLRRRYGSHRARRTARAATGPFAQVARAYRAQR